MSIPLSKKEKEGMLGEGGGVLSNKRKFALILLLSPKVNTTFKPTIKINLYQRNVISSVYTISKSSLWP